jgi:hypothetical protein
VSEETLSIRVAERAAAVNDGIDGAKGNELEVP